jgi:hypothetical protein
MILTKRSLRKWEESTFTFLTAEQQRIILKRFGSEPEPDEWSEQDISEQIRKIIQEYPAPKRKYTPWA